jgi:hypothetical protein
MELETEKTARDIRVGSRYRLKQYLATYKRARFHLIMCGISDTVAQANRFPRSQSCEGVLGLGVLPSHSRLRCLELRL